MAGPRNFYNSVDQRKLGTDLISGIKSDIDDLNEVVGDSDSGLIKDINDLNTAVTSIPIVTANPEDQATGTLSSLKVNNVVYGIPAGGSDVEVFEMITNPNDPKQRVFPDGASFTDVYNAIEAGKAVIIKCPGVTASNTCYLSLTNIDVMAIAHRNTYYFTTVTHGYYYIELKFVKTTSAIPTYGDFEYGIVTVTDPNA